MSPTSSGATYLASSRSPAHLPAGREISHAAKFATCGDETPSTFVRWLKFNLVGAIGIGVQFAALFLLKSVLGLDYLFATGIAVEMAVVHNFVWHERFTWADRVQRSWRGSLSRFARFNLTTGAVSILGNLALMKVMVGQAHMNYLLANAVAIALCALANFLVSDGWVFEG